MPQSMGGEMRLMVRWHPDSSLKTLVCPNIALMSMSLQAQMNLWAIRRVIPPSQTCRFQLQNVGMAKTSRVWVLIL